MMTFVFDDLVYSAHDIHDYIKAAVCGGSTAAPRFAHTQSQTCILHNCCLSSVAFLNVLLLLPGSYHCNAAHRWDAS